MPISGRTPDRARVVGSRHKEGESVEHGVYGEGRFCLA